MDREIVLRPFRQEDAEAFRVLNEVWIRKHFGMEEKDREVLGDPAGHILGPGGAILMAFDNERPIGCCALIYVSKGEYEVAKMTVVEDYRGQGLGRQILAGIVEQAKALGARRLYLETNSILQPAIQLYESIGFQHLPPERVQKSAFARANVYMEMLLDTAV